MRYLAFRASVAAKTEWVGHALHLLYRTPPPGATGEAHVPVKNGAHNLLVNCIGVNAGQRVLLIEERADESLYCPQMGDMLAAQVAALGADTLRFAAAQDACLRGLPPAVGEMMAGVDHAIFLNRIGDYSRFFPLPGGCSKTICYALDGAALASPFAGVSHHLTSQLLARLESELMRAQRWRISCPLGTDISGSFCWPSQEGSAEDDDFTLSLFPVTTFKPVPCNTASGRVMLSRWLMPGAAAKVQPAVLRFDDVVSVTVRDGLISAIDGPPASARAVAEHYDFIAAALDVSRNRVHSWHAGINPSTFFAGSADTDLERWSAVSFASPRYLHFHTCGDMPPGEIAWSVFNPTVWIDDQAYWQDGQFVWLQRPDNTDLISQYDGAEVLLATSAEIGI